MSQGKTTLKVVFADRAHSSLVYGELKESAAGGDGAGKRVYAGNARYAEGTEIGHTGHLLLAK